MSWIGKVQGVSVSRQCALTGVARSSLHAQQGPKVVDKEDLRISQLVIPPLITELKSRVI